MNHTQPRFKLVPTPRQVFGSFVDCNMAEAWVGDTFRIFPGKYGEDPVWGEARELKYGDGSTCDEAFALPTADFVAPTMPPNTPPGTEGLHGAVWFETLYQDPTDHSGRTLYALYHNENYPSTLPYDPATGSGYRNEKWPPGLQGDKSIQAVCRIGIMHSSDGGESWTNRGILLEDLQPRMILWPVNRNNTFPGGVGDPSAVASGDYLYVFFGEYAYPESYDEKAHDPVVEWRGQCISVARVSLSRLDTPTGSAHRWNGKAFAAPYDGVGQPIAALRVPMEDNGGPVSAGNRSFHWGPSVSWNEHLECWVMLMGRVDAGYWVGSRLYISFNPHRDLGEGANSQAWSTPELLFERKGHTLWYPSLQPLATPEDVQARRTCLRLGKRARLWFKDMADAHEYISDFEVVFERGE